MLFDRLVKRFPKLP